MGFFDRLFGTEEQNAPQQNSQRSDSHAASARTDDEIAVERYRYLLRTAPPETIEQVHTEAFSKLTEEQRDLLFRELSDGAPAGEAPRDTSARSLATSATRQELRNPGTMERSLGGNGANGGNGGGGIGFGGMLASSLLGTVAGYVIGSALVSAFMPDMNGSDASADSADGGSDGSADSGADSSADAGAASDGGGDFGGGDLGGGDFGGGDFGGFDF